LPSHYGHNPGHVEARRRSLAFSAFNLGHEQERWPKIAFADVKDYQKAAA
jgi:hypothetical protein